MISGSITNVNNLDNEQKIKIPVNTIETMMKKNEHKNIDLLKMDIEGAALSVLTSIFESNIYPYQLVVEIEFPKKINKKFFKDLQKLFKLMVKLNYKIWCLPRNYITTKGRIYMNYSLELVALKQ